MGLRSGTWLRTICGLGIVIVALSTAAATSAAPGDWTQAQVNTAVENGVAYIDSKQNADGSFGFSYPPAETAFALISYGALSNQNFSSLSATYQDHVKKAVAYMLGLQAADGSFGCFYCTYTTGLALDGLQANLGANPGLPTAPGPICPALTATAAAGTTTLASAGLTSRTPASPSPGCS